MRVAEYSRSFPGRALDGPNVNLHAVDAHVDYRHAYLWVGGEFAHGSPAP